MTTKPELCLISGWGFDTRALDGLVSALRGRWNVIALALPGYGSIPVTAPPIDIDGLAMPLLPLVHRDTTLVGWSLGGMAAIRMAAILQHKVRGLILLASTPCFVRSGGWPWGISPVKIRDLAARLPDARDRVLREFAWLVARGDLSPRQTARKLIDLTTACPATIDILLGGLHVLKETDLRADLTHLKCPVTMLLGEHDALVPAETGHAAKALHPGLRIYCIRGTGHAPFISRCSLTARLLGEGIRAHHDEPV